MKNRIFCALLSGMMLTSVMAGCNTQTPSNQGESTAGEPANTAAESNENDEIVEIYWQYPASSEVSDGFYEMEDTLNEMMERDIGVHVTFIPTTLDGALQDATLLVSGGEKLDICMSWGTLGQYVEKGLIIPIDDLLETTNTGDMLTENNANPYIKVSYNNETYGIPAGNTLSNAYSYNMKKSYADKYGIEVDDSKFYTLDEMEQIFETIGAGEEGNIICQVPWNNTYEPLNYNLCEYDKFGGDMSYGVLMLNRGFDTTDIVNMFETEEYADYCDRMYAWAQKGWISPDAAVTTDTVADIASRDDVVGYFGWGASENDMLENNEISGDVIQLRILDDYIQSTADYFSWNIPITAENPQKSLEAIAYIYENKEAAWLIQFGIEGESYNIVSEEGDYVTAAYTAEDVNQLPYYNVYGLWGNRLDWPTFGTTSPELSKKKSQYEEQAYSTGRVTSSAGYVFKTETVSAEIAAVQTIMAQYCTSLNCGALDPSKALPELIAAVKSAGIDDIIAENQSQFDEWRAQQ